MAKKKPTPPAARPVDEYRHKQATGPRVPEAGAQPYVKAQPPAARYRYDSSLAPALEWDERNPAREEAEALIAAVLDAPDLAAAKAAAARLKAMSAPFLNWAGKAERPEIDVPTLPLFVHERLSTTGIIETLKGHRRDKTGSLFDFFNDPHLSVAEQAMKAYEHGPWSNRMILGDNLAVMSWLLRGENLGGQVQMIYLDPPYGIKYGSNFQPFVRKRDVSHNDDDDLTREPEMVQAYRDTWEVGLHSYLTYLRDRLTVARDLLHPSGSIFVQIGEQHAHHARELLDEVFGAENFVAMITFVTTTGSTGSTVPATCDYLLMYARDATRLKYHQLHVNKGASLDGPYSWLQLADGTRRRATSLERAGKEAIPDGARVFRLDNLQSQSGGRDKGDGAACWFPVAYSGREWKPSLRSTWKTNQAGMARLNQEGRFFATTGGLYYVRFLDDFAVQPISNNWTDTVIAGFASEKLYVVETSTKVVQRCILMTTDPGDLVLDLTCGSGTTAYVAEQWGRRWITIDVSRVPLALARQRLLTATFDWYELKDEDRGPAGGFVYKRRQNKKGEEVGGIVPHVTLKSIANGEPPAEEVLVDRPEVNGKVIRVTGPFTYEASIPKATDPTAEQPPAASEGFAARLLDALRRSPRLHLAGNHAAEVKNVRPPARSLHLSAEGELHNGKANRVAFVFGPENGPVTDKQVLNGLREAHAKGYDRLLVIGLNIQPGARLTVENAADMGLVPASYLQATPDLLMGDLLKNMKSSQVFSVCGLPEVAVRRAGAPAPPAAVTAKGKKPAAAAAVGEQWQVELKGLDVFDPVTMEALHRSGSDVPAWFLDTDYNEKCFHVCQAFFPRTAAWDNLKRELKAGYAEGVWDHLAGTVSAPFAPGEHRQVAVKVIDDRGNELMVVKPLA